MTDRQFEVMIIMLDTFYPPVKIKENITILFIKRATLKHSR